MIRAMDSPRGALAAALAALLCCTIAPRAAHAVAVSPRVVAAARGTDEEARVRDRLARYDAARAQGVDRVDPAFALDLAKFPRDGVAHRNVLVVLVDFPSDGYGPALRASGTSKPSYYHRLFFSDDPTDGVTSMREYYRENSGGRLLLSGRVTPKWLTMPQSAAFYVNGVSGLDFGGYPRSSQKLAEDAMAAAYRELGDLEYFDNDGPDGVPHSGDDDGYVDAVCVIHPGQGAELLTGTASDQALWSHQAGIAIYASCPPGTAGPGCLPGLYYGNVRGYLYILTPEFNDFPGDNSCGTYFHEFGHTLGLPDLYDFSAAGLGFYSLMGLGNYLPVCTLSDPGCAPLGTRPGNLDAWCRQYLGFESPAVPATAGPQTLAPATRGGGALKIWTNGQPGSEYLLVENRLREGPDSDLPGDGLVVYHVEDTRVDNLAGPASYRVRILAADGQNDLESPTGNFGDAGDPFPGTSGATSLTESTTPSSRDYANQDTGVRLTNIAVTTAGANPAATFDLVVSPEPEIRLAGWTTDDAGGDGYPDNGEAVTLSVTVRNVGSMSGVTQYTLATADAGISITQNLTAGAPLAPYGTETLAGAFVFTVGNYATLPHDVPFTLSWNDGSASGVMPFTLTVGMGPGLAADFEGGLGAWTGAALPPTATNEWHSSGVRFHGGSQSAKCGSTLPLGSGSNEAQTYNSNQDAALTSPIFDLPPNSQLSFWSFIDAETNGGTGAWDGGRVEIAGADGAWKLLAVDGGYPYLLENSFDNTLRGSPAFSGSPNVWRRVVADLSAWSGPARIRFRFASDGADEPVGNFGELLRYYEGWYVDDVTVQPRVAPGPTPRRVSLRAGPSPYLLGAPSAGSIHIRFSARDGLPHPGAVGRVRVYDLNGRLIRSLVATPGGLAPSQFEATWNARAEDGTKVAAGIYYLQSELLGQTESFRLVVLK